MPQSANPSLGELKRETEQTRANLAQTVEQLRSSVSDTATDIRRRISPEVIKAEVSDYVRSRSERLVDDMTAAARRNPMQAVAVGASIAYPMLKLARAIPMPVLMIGAGLFFTSSKSGQSAVRKASEKAADISEGIMQQGQDFSDRLVTSAATVRDAAAGAVEKAGDALSGGTDRVRDAAGAASAVVSDGSDTVGKKVASVLDTAIGAGKDLTGRVADLAASANARVGDLAADTSAAAQSILASSQASASEKAGQLRDAAVSAQDRVGTTVFETIEKNPLLVAGVGLLLGGLMASLLPRSDAEDSLLGRASGTARKRANEAASSGFNAVKNAAGEIVDNVVRQAGSEGITTEAIGSSTRDIGERVRRVAEAAVTTAFEPDHTSTQSADKGDHHG